MKVSVIIRAYNRGYIIREAIESALGQGYRNSELIIVDDGSTDDTREVVESIGSDRIRYLRHTRNRGVGAACNTGISAATGEAVAFLDSDDLWKPYTLERQIDFLSEHPGVGAVFSDVQIVDGDSVVPSLIALMRAFPKLLQPKSEKNEYVFSGRQMYLCLLEEVPIKPSALVLRRDIISRLGLFDEECRSGEDWEFLLRLSRATQFGYIDLPLAVQRRTRDATHLRYKIEDKSFLLNVFLRQKALLRNDSEALHIVNRGIYSHCNNLASNYLLLGKRREAISTYLLGFRETRRPGLLLRSAFAIMPSGTRRSLHRIIRGS
jgi:glycosyltransferase involved in cell wall biosynthesis